MNQSTARTRSGGLGRGLGLAVLLAACLASPAQGAEGADDLSDAIYRATLARERGLRAPGAHATLDELRAVLARYESIAQRYPRGDLRVHSLWQGAGLAIEAYDLYRQSEDFETGLRLLYALERQHPTSAFAGRVTERLEQLDALAAVAWLNDISREPLSRGSRIMLSFDREVSFASEHLDNPARLFFDFRGTEAALSLRNTTVPLDDDPVIDQIRLGRHPNQVTRVVLDLRDSVAADCRSFTLYDPFRLVVDCLQATPPTRALLNEPYLVPLPQLGHQVELLPLAAAFPEADVITARELDPVPSAGLSAPPSMNSSGVFSVARQLGLGVSRVVIDPGHGGRDPGARRNGLSEADLVLDVALRLQRRLANALPDLDVILTRRDDASLSLEERTALANRVGADLFLSIHANASANPEARGVETYFLSLSTDPDVDATAARENSAGDATMRHLETLVEAIATSSKVEESRDFAQTIQEALVQGLQPIDQDLPDLGVKEAPFRVLIGARMPSVLSEIAFLTNTRDADLLATDAYRDHIADALLEGIVRYQQSLGALPLFAIANNDL